MNKMTKKNRNILTVSNLIFALVFCVNFSVKAETHTDEIYGWKHKLQKQIKELKRQNEMQQQSIDELKALLGCVVKIDNDFIIEGCNLHVRNALGQTDSTDETGNVIIGYNEDISIGDGSQRTGSHNLIMGVDHRYTSYGTIVHGTGHSTSVQNAAAIGGAHNRPHNFGAVIIGGSENFVSASQSVVIGGSFNDAGGASSVVVGGQSNSTFSFGSLVAGGNGNEADGGDSAVFGGQGNQAMAGWSVVVGGQGNAAWGEHSTVTGGRNRSVNGPYDWRAGTLFETE
ncbi:hypothetical protein [Aliikangiella coralliicola]|uniref:Trimeric autotransporter adhesin YadA-like head domain-containing protein n=1 Tax=Aliikangiella coralliicola TaxID=2592383 RepID=A0A545UJG3_9GAMM|nr:hypothetical protein [Aliikangiella coralliicola]TQV89602.1 hypothetical protein FLL46_01590 [Aliikangiella coralliicola]